MNNELLIVEDLNLVYIENEQEFSILNNLSFKVQEKEIFGLVGESGCGKSMTAMAIMRLFDHSRIKIKSGKIFFKGKNLLELSEKEIRKIRTKEIAMVFQDPMTSLNPVYSIESQIVEAILEHKKISRKAARREAVDLLEVVGIPDPQKNSKKFPHEFSGGMRQRAMIAMSLSCNPSLLISDESTTALDVTVQHQILSLILDLKEKFKMSVILITHDLGLVCETSDRIGVMYAGDIIETFGATQLFEQIFHPYTKGLIGCIPKINVQAKQLKVILGIVPPLTERGAGCLFYSRCPDREDKCKTNKPTLKKIDKKNHQVACWLSS